MLTLKGIYTSMMSFSMEPKSWKHW